MPNDPTPKISEKAVELLARAQFPGHESWEQADESVKKVWRRRARHGLRAAYYSIRSSLLEELKRELLSKGSIETFCYRRNQLWQHYTAAEKERARAETRRGIQAAFSSLASEGAER